MTPDRAHLAHRLGQAIADKNQAAMLHALLGLTLLAAAQDWLAWLRQNAAGLRGWAALDTVTTTQIAAWTAEECQHWYAARISLPPGDSAACQLAAAIRSGVRSCMTICALVRRNSPLFGTMEPHWHMVEALIETLNWAWQAVVAASDGD